MRMIPHQWIDGICEDEEQSCLLDEPSNLV